MNQGFSYFLGIKACIFAIYPQKLNLTRKSFFWVFIPCFLSAYPNEALAHFASLLQIQQLAILYSTRKLPDGFIPNRLVTARDGAHDVRGTSVLRGPERSGDLEPMRVSRMGSDPFGVNHDHQLSWWFALRL